MNPEPKNQNPSVGEVDINSLAGEIQAALKELRETAKKNEANPTQLGDGKIKYAKETETHEKLESIHKKINDLEDKFKTQALKKNASEKYSSVEGLAKALTPKNADTFVQESCFQTAKAILDDPLNEDYTAGWKKALRKGRSLDVEKAMLELVEKVKSNDVNPDESFIKKSLNTIVGQDGGYLMPPERSMMIHKVLYETSPVRSFADVKTVSTGEWKFVVQTEEPLARWKDEEITESEETEAQKYEEGTISVHQLSAEPRISLNALEDSFYDLEGELLKGLVARFARAENKAFIDGLGGDRPQGLNYYAGKGAVDVDHHKKPLAIQWGVSATGDITADHLQDLEASLFSQYKMGAAWLMNRPTKNIIRQLKTAQGEYLFSWGQGWGGFNGLEQIRDGRHGSILMYPVYECDDLQTANESGQRFPIYFGNFKSYCVLDRIGISMIIDDLTRKGYRKYYTRKRVGGGLVLGQGIKVLRQSK